MSTVPCAVVYGSCEGEKWESLDVCCTVILSSPLVPPAVAGIRCLWFTVYRMGAEVARPQNWGCSSWSSIFGVSLVQQCECQMEEKGKRTMAKSLRLEIEEMWTPLREIQAEDAAIKKANQDAGLGSAYAM